MLQVHAAVSAAMTNQSAIRPASITPVLRWIVPPVLAAGGALALLVCWLPDGGFAVSDAARLAAGLALVLAVCAWSLRRAVRDVRAGIAANLAAIESGAGVPPAAADDPLGRRMAGVELALRLARGRIEALEAQHRQDLASLRDTAERYELAVSGANDGMLEWDLKTGRAEFSPRWSSMLGYDAATIPPSADAWFSRVHPDDAADVARRLDDHLAGRTARFECEHRLRRSDGGWLWVLARAQALRNAAGTAYRVVGLHTDISQRRQVQEMLMEIADGLATAHGEDFYRTLVRNFAAVLRTRDAFLCQVVDTPASRVRTLAYWTRGAFRDNVEFALEGTSCEEVIRTGRALYCPRDVGERWPLETRVYGRESYLGLPIFDSTGSLIGHIACMDDKPMPEALPHQAVMKLFAVCAATEMERRQLARLH